MKYKHEKENQTKIISIDAQDFIKAILKDAISGEIKFICNNKYGNEWACIVSDILDDSTSFLNMCDSVCIRRIVFEGTESMPEFVLTDFSNQKKESVSDKGLYGMEVCTENNTIYMPFIAGGGSSHFCCNNKSRSSIC